MCKYSKLNLNTFTLHSGRLVHTHQRATALPLCSSWAREGIQIELWILTHLWLKSGDFCRRKI